MMQKKQHETDNMHPEAPFFWGCRPDPRPSRQSQHLTWCTHVNKTLG